MVTVSGTDAADRYGRPLGWLTIAILVVGIVMVHFPEGWYVVGGGRNGMEYNVVLMAVLLAIMYPEGWRRSTAAESSTFAAGDQGTSG